MVKEMKNRHPGRIDKNGERTKMPVCCGTHSGWFCCTKGMKRSENMSQELGSGITIYFKTLKSLSLLFIALTVISLPALILYWNG